MSALTSEEIDRVNAASFDWPLEASSVVVELGGYKGRWASEIARRYNSQLYVFEPQQWAWEQCRRALAPWPVARVFDFALGLDAGDFSMGDWGTDGCSFLKGQDQLRPVGAGRMQEFGQVLRGLGLRRIDLLLMNIEGYEYSLLPHLFDTGWIPDRIAGLMVQFHAFADPDGIQYAALRERIDRLYEARFDFGTTLVGWERRPC